LLKEEKEKLFPMKKGGGSVFSTRGKAVFFFATIGDPPLK